MDVKRDAKKAGKAERLLENTIYGVTTAAALVACVTAVIELNARPAKVAVPRCAPTVFYTLAAAKPAAQPPADAGGAWTRVTRTRPPSLNPPLPRC